MIPRIHITRPSVGGSSNAHQVFGTGNELVDLDELGRPLHRHSESNDRYSGNSKRSSDSEEDFELGGVEEDFGFEFELDDQGRLLRSGGVGRVEREKWEIEDGEMRERWKWWKIYGMHFLFMWNSRTFEYVSMFLVAFAFPDSLTATSIRGITSTLSSLLCSSAVGNWIDRTEVFSALTMSIILNHIAIIASYIAWLLWPLLTGSSTSTPHSGNPFSNIQMGTLYGIILFLDIIHDLSHIGNRFALERNLVPALIGPVTLNMKYDLPQVNSVMTRLDLIVSLIAPSLLPVLMSSFATQTGWLLLLIALTILLWVAELFLIFKIITLKELEPGTDSPPLSPSPYSHTDNANQPGTLSPTYPSKRPLLKRIFNEPTSRLQYYFSTQIWPASLATSLLQLTVLAYSATLITYLLEIGFSVTSITIARASGAITALLSTIVTPILVHWMRRRQANRGDIRGGFIEVADSDGEGKKDDDERTEVESEVRIAALLGFWGVAGQFVYLVPVALTLFLLPTSSSNASSTPPQISIILPLLLFTSLSLSRLPHHLTSLMTSQLGQTSIPSSHRSSFAGTEQSFRSLFELVHWGMTVIFSRKESFRWLAAGSVGVCGVAMLGWGSWVRGRWGWGFGEGGGRRRRGGVYGRVSAGEGVEEER